ncbi:MAG: glycoside hydrolase family 3 protein [Actinomycetota bacterium]|nr:glycoside hydrolase family 3 protein [Actinomycetota bacterium]
MTTRPCGLLMLSFDGTEAPPEVLSTIAGHDGPGVTLFRHRNYRDATQVTELTTTLQASRRVDDPLLIATDQETGQFMAIGEPATAFAGNMALGAAADPELTRRVGKAIGTEMRALGVNVDYAPVADVNTNPANPALGIRSFGDDPVAVARHVAATVNGLQSVGVAATMKHFPGKGDAHTDSHHALPVLGHDRHRLEAVELVPFKAAIAAGVKLAMTGHFALPAVTGSDELPGTLAHEVLTTLLRDELSFEGVVITDALDMKALTQGTAQIIDVVAAVRAGVDLLLLTAESGMQERITTGLQLALSRRLIDPAMLERSRERITDLRAWVGRFPNPPLEVVGCKAHRDLAKEVAERSITVVRDSDSLLPLRSGHGAILVVQPEPTDLTLADTSSFETPSLADALRRHHRNIDDMVVSHRPDAAAIAAVAERAARADVAVVGTVAASLEPAQADLANAVLATGIPTVTIAMRTPYDLGAYPQSGTHLATYSISRPSLEVAADVMFGTLLAAGKLPVGIAGLYERGHGV